MGPMRNEHRHESRARVSERVTRPIEWPRPRGPIRRLLSAALTVPTGNVAPGTSTTTGPTTTGLETVEDVVLSDDLDAEVSLERIVAEDSSGGLHDVVLSQVDARVEGLPGFRLALAQLTGATPREQDHPRRADAPWELTVADGDQRLTLHGPWASFAWLGQLAGWAAPC